MNSISWYKSAKPPGKRVYKIKHIKIVDKGVNKSLINSNTINHNKIDNKRNLSQGIDYSQLMKQSNESSCYTGMITQLLPEEKKYDYTRSQSPIKALSKQIKSHMTYSSSSINHHHNKIMLSHTNNRKKNRINNKHKSLNSIDTNGVLLELDTTITNNHYNKTNDTKIIPSTLNEYKTEQKQSNLFITPLKQYKTFHSDKKPYEKSMILMKHLSSCPPVKNIFEKVSQFNTEQVEINHEIARMIHKKKKIFSLHKIIDNLKEDRMKDIAALYDLKRQRNKSQPSLQIISEAKRRKREFTFTNGIIVKYSKAIEGINNKTAMNLGKSIIGQYNKEKSMIDNNLFKLRKDYDASGNNIICTKIDIKKKRLENNHKKIQQMGYTLIKTHFDTSHLYDDLKAHNKTYS